MLPTLHFASQKAIRTSGILNGLSGCQKQTEDQTIYYRVRDRIEAHICISFTSYTIYKELERILYKEKSNLLVKQAAELAQNMY